MEYNKIYNGDSLEVLKTFPDDSIDSVMTSPPYFSLRDYGTANWEGGNDINCDHKIPDYEQDPKNPQAGSHISRFNKEYCYKCGAKRVDKQIGLESTYQEYIDKLCNIFDEVKRVLKPTGTCFVNMGDSYSNQKTGNTETKIHKKAVQSTFKKQKQDIPEKCLLQIPARFSIEMTNRGWILRNKIIWYKPSCMPASVTDRLTVDFEEVLFFVKNKKYFFDAEAVKEPTVTKDNNVRNRDIGKLNNTPGRSHMSGLKTNNYEKRNKRCVWKINPKPFKEAHFATYCEELCQTPIIAGCPEFICNKCGKIRKRIFERVDSESQRPRKFGHDGNDDRNDTGNVYKEKISKFVGYDKCDCDAGFSGGVVLDPFFGAGTTGVVAKKLGRNYIGIELNPEYIKIAEKRLSETVKQLSLL